MKHFADETLLHFCPATRRGTCPQPSGSQHDSVARYSRDFVKHIFLGRGVFTSDNTIEVAGKTLKFDKVGEGGEVTVVQ